MKANQCALTKGNILFLVLPPSRRDFFQIRHKMCIIFHGDFYSKKRVANVVGNKGNGDQIPS